MIISGQLSSYSPGALRQCFLVTTWGFSGREKRAGGMTQTAGNPVPDGFDSPGHETSFHVSLFPIKKTGQFGGSDRGE
jgi:hypothetical protein